jgi:short-subunit dehydrogenase
MNRNAKRRQELARQAILRRRRLCALVTGASSGIGRELSHLLAEKGHDLVLVARRTDLLKELAAELETGHGITATVITADLGDVASPGTIVDELHDRGIEVDVLVNNAGYTMDGHFLAFPWEQHHEYVKVMAVAPTELTYRFLPGMVRRGFGQVLNVASVGGLLPGTPFDALYGPSKIYLITLTRSLAVEWNDAGISFSAFCPGPVRDTAIVETRHGVTWTRVPAFLSDLRESVEGAWAALEKDKMVQVWGPVSQGVYITGRLLPTQFWARLNGRMVRWLGKEPLIRCAADAGLSEAR